MAHLVTFPKLVLSLVQMITHVRSFICYAFFLFVQYLLISWLLEIVHALAKFCCTFHGFVFDPSVIAHIQEAM